MKVRSLLQGHLNEDDYADCISAATAAKSLQSCPTLCDPIDGGPPGSPVPGILQARTLEWVAISFSNAWKGKVKVKSLSRVRLFATPWSAAYQAPPFMGFSRQEYWSGVPLHFCQLPIGEHFPRMQTHLTHIVVNTNNPFPCLTPLTWRAGPLLRTGDHRLHYPLWGRCCLHPAAEDTTPSPKKVHLHSTEQPQTWVKSEAQAIGRVCNLTQIKFGSGGRKAKASFQAWITTSNIFSNKKISTY